MRPPRLTQQQQALVTAHLPLAYRVARLWLSRQMRGCPARADDYRGIAALALCEAARRFDPARGLRFSTVAWVYCRNALANYARLEQSWHRERQGGSSTALDRPASRVREPEYDQREAVAVLLRKAGRIRATVRAFLTVGSNAATARRLGVTSEAIRQRLGRLRERLRRQGVSILGESR